MGQLFAMFPDFLFSSGIARHWWMDLFLGHIPTHFGPGRNALSAMVFLVALGACPTVIAPFVASHRPSWTESGRPFVSVG